MLRVDNAMVHLYDRHLVNKFGCSLLIEVHRVPDWSTPITMHEYFCHMSISSSRFLKQVYRENITEVKKKKKHEGFFAAFSNFSPWPLLLLKGKERASVNLLCIDSDQVQQQKTALCFLSVFKGIVPHRHHFLTLLLFLTCMKFYCCTHFSFPCNYN